MSKTRVSNLAEKLGIETKEVLTRLKELGYDVKSGTSTVDDEAVARLTAARPDDTGPEEVRVTTTIVRRRARVAPPAPAAAEAAVPPAVEPVAEPVPEQTPPVAEKKPVVKKAPEKTIEAAAPAPAPETTVEPVAPAPPPAAVVEAPAATPITPAKTEPAAKPAVPAQPERASANQARILGRVEIPITPEPRPARRDQGRAPGAPGDRGPRTPGSGDFRGPRTPGTPDNRPPRPGGPSREGGAPRDGAARPAGGRPVQMTPVDIPPLGDDRRKGTPPGRKGPATKDGGDAARAKKGAAGKGKGREQFTKTTLLDREERLFDPVHKSRRKGQKERIEPGKTELTVPKAIKRIIKISETITIGELAKRMGIKATDLIKAMMKLGSMVTINHVLDHDAAVLLAADYGYEVENVAVDLDEILESTPDTPESLQKRPPVVTIMGHVDHGKTSLLDAIRKTNVIGGEAGGITQHIGAYDVELHGRKITFLDTPGHEAFTAMRARGAKVTDIVILVVAADDGVMPQTREAINHSKAAGVPILVAINKIDKPDAKPERVRQELTEHGLVAEEWGGDTTMVEVSAKQRLNLEELLEMVLLQADVMDLKANPAKEAKGTIVEGKLDKGRGPVATVLVQEGTLRVGDYCVVGVHSGRVRAMQNDRGERVAEAGPSTPVELVGLSGVPDAGDIFVAMKDEKQAREIATLRQIKQRELELAKHAKMSLDDLYKQIQSGEVKDLNVIVKADVQGSVEAVADSLRKQSTEAVRLNVIHTAVGAITESDVNLATASNAIIIGFNIRPEVKAQTLAEKEGVDIRLYNVIYDAVDDVRKAMEGLLSPVFKEKYLGRAEVREVFSVPKIGSIAGCYVVDGKFIRNAQVRLLRDNVVVYQGKLGSLRRFKDDVKEVASGYECGMGLENYNDIKVGDVIEAFEMEKTAAKL
ncbi:translation initiation factor IF-2 [Trichlorobacter ammonificans]|uniref:Translation initiation factor IF-2 n=1 Tax=Trichlorobacter ammonificans TaxID=2916410 RepID=A0ABN8HLK8_9BACT|nr:translation initiation factor IF-2 [Trichlorobacter ammonificans]CAH2030856.1 Translation initiation factor IF-2 [Trichlorobacter ammonificans]